MSKAETNRANAEHSTGPKSPEGKQKSASNSLTHGLTAQHPVLPTEDPEAFVRHLQSFLDEYDPEGATETHLVHSLADTSWRQNRLVALETAVIAAADLKGLANLSLHSQRLSRQFERTVTQLRDLQQLRRDREALDVREYLDILEMYESRKQPYLAIEDGFVFSEAQIDRGIQSRNRERDLEEVRAAA